MLSRNLIAVTAALALSFGLTATASATNTREIVTSAINELMVKKDVSAVDRYFAEPYIQHNQSVPTGLKALKGLARAVIAGNPKFKYSLSRVIIDGDIGIVHGVYEGFGPVPLVAFDVFRVEGEKIVEHWDNLSPVAAKNPSGRTQIDGTVKVSDLDKTATNKALVKNFIDNVLIKGEFSRLPEFFDGDNYIQHNSNIADGLSGLGAGLKALADAGISMRITKTHKLYGEGNFVFVMSEGEFGGKPTAFFDLFRVANGKIAEHWDVISPVIAANKAANTNGKF